LVDLYLSYDYSNNVLYTNNKDKFSKKI
jgi:hypothetical protein